MRIKFFCTLLLAAIMACSVMPVQAFTERGFLQESYVYNRFGATIFYPTIAPMPYRFSHSVGNDAMGVDSFLHLTEIQYHNERFFITNGTQLIVTDNDLRATDILEGMYVDGEWVAFTPLNGIFITPEGDIYVADTANGIVWHLNENLHLVRALGRPPGIPLAEDIAYRPLKVAVDFHGRIYVIAEGVNEGIVEMNPDGTFNRYFGVIEVNPSTMQLFWRQLQTPAQRIRSRMWVPVNFTNLTVDKTGFVFATLSDAENEIGAKKLNARGENIMRRPDDDFFTHTVGDMEFNHFGIGVPHGPSIITDIEVTDFGVYYLFDNNRNRVFAYDQDGYMLFAFGGSGNREGNLQNVNGMSMASGNRLVFADRGNRSIEVFERTEYGNMLLAASYHQYHHDYNMAAFYWREVLRLNPFFQYANVGVGIALYRAGEFDLAMQYFQRGQHVTFYSQAFQQVRSNNMYEYFNTIMIVLLSLIFVYFAYSIIKKRVIAKRKGVEV